jgi:hypothetical protein
MVLDRVSERRTSDTERPNGRVYHQHKIGY